MEISLKSQKSLTILMGAYNGEKHIPEQLDSLSAQTYQNWRLIVSDDGSSDSTLEIVKAYQFSWGFDRVEIVQGPQKQFAQNFLSLACNDTIDSDYYAYSDQDDVWECDHLARALDWLQTMPVDIPALYTSRTRYITEDGIDAGFSGLFKKSPSFCNALVQSIAGGNTMVFNNAARLLIATTGAQINVASHDWWVYLLVTGCGGYVHYDSYPGVRYRQHGSNISGQNITFAAKVHRIKALLAGRFSSWNQFNVNALNEIRVHLTEPNKSTLSAFEKARDGFILLRIYYLYRSGVYRQTFLGNLGLLIAAIVKKL